jgi:DeoR/GlpR family transcriptional regulator of sugar metabolism
MAGRSSSVKPRVRQQEIFDLIVLQGEVSVETLAIKFHSSQETIRRDLSVLADAGRIRKVHGGARQVLRCDEGAFDERMGRNALAKRLIAEKITKLITPRQTIFMDTGSTTLICAEALARVKNLIVVTNSTRIAATFASGTGEAEVYLLGGRYINGNSQTVGSSTISDIQKFRADHAIITIGALDMTGAMDYSNDEAQVGRSMIEAASRLTIVADSSKYEHRAAFKVCDLEEINNLIVDKFPEPALYNALIENKVGIL